MPKDEERLLSAMFIVRHAAAIYEIFAAFDRCSFFADFRCLPRSRRLSPPFFCHIFSRLRDAAYAPTAPTINNTLRFFSLLYLLC